MHKICVLFVRSIRIIFSYIVHIYRIHCVYCTGALRCELSGKAGRPERRWPSSRSAPRRQWRGLLRLLRWLTDSTCPWTIRVQRQSWRGSDPVQGTRVRGHTATTAPARGRSTRASKACNEYHVVFCPNAWWVTYCESAHRLIKLSENCGLFMHDIIDSIGIYALLLLQLYDEWITEYVFQTHKQSSHVSDYR
jgi:hypothetical protein